MRLVWNLYCCELKNPCQSCQLGNCVIMEHVENTLSSYSSILGSSVPSHMLEFISLVSLMQMQSTQITGLGADYRNRFHRNTHVTERSRKFGQAQGHIRWTNIHKKKYQYQCLDVGCGWTVVHAPTGVCRLSCKQTCCPLLRGRARERLMEDYEKWTSLMLLGRGPSSAKNKHIKPKCPQQLAWLECAFLGPSPSPRPNIYAYVAFVNSSSMRLCVCVLCGHGHDFVCWPREPGTFFVFRLTDLNALPMRPAIALIKYAPIFADRPGPATVC